MTVLKPRVKAVVLCDDIRMENNGKVMLIGIYNSSIAIGRIPGRGLFKAAIVVDFPDAGDYIFKFQVTDTADPNIMEPEIGITMIEGGNNIVIPAFDFVVEINDDVDIEIKYFDESWASIGSWSLRKSTDTVVEEPNG